MVPRGGLKRVDAGQDVLTVEEAFQTHYEAIWRYAALMTQSRADADDVSSEVFERAVAADRAGTRPELGWLPWLLLVARRKIVSRWRRRRLIRFIPILAGQPNLRDGQAHLDDAELRIWLDQMTKTLPARQREALFLRFIDDLDDRAIGHVLGISASGVRSLRARAIATLRQHEELWR